MNRILLAVLLLIVSPAWAQVTVTQLTVVSCDVPIPAGVKAEYDWYADASVRIAPNGNGATANLSGEPGTYDGAVVAKFGDKRVATAFTVTLGNAPAPPDLVTLRSLVTDAEAKLIAEYFTGISKAVSQLKSPEQFWQAYEATFPVKGNAKLDTAIRARLKAALLKPLEFSKGLLDLAAEFDSAPVPPKPEPEPVVTQGARAVVIVHETGDNNPDFGSLQVSLQRPNGSSQKYLKAGKHTLEILDDELGGKWSDVLKGKVAGMVLPALFVIDPKTNEVLFGQSIPVTYTADNVIERLRENGG